MKPSRAGLALAAITVFFLAANVVWLRLDRTVPPWDDSYYLTSSLIMYDALTDEGLRGYARQFLTLMGTRPPLIAALPAPVYLAFGRKFRAAYAINLLFLTATFAALFRLGRRYASPRAGLLAVWIAGTMPILYGLARSFLVECGLIALVSVAIYLTADWNESSGAGRALLIGLVCGLGLLIKTSFPVYVALPLLYLAITTPASVLRLKPLLAFTGAAALLAAPWYVVNFRQVLATAMKAGSAETADVYGTGAILSLAAIAHYLHMVANAGPTLYFAALPLLAAAAAVPLRPSARERTPRGTLTAFTETNRSSRPSALGATLTGEGVRVCAVWMAPLLFLTFGHYRDVRYAAPLFPALALALAILADDVIGRWGVKACACLGALLLLPLLSMLQTSFGILGGRPLELGGALLRPPMLSYARRFDRVVSPCQEILADLYRLSKFTGAERKTVLVGANVLSFNADNFKLAAVQRKLPFDIDTTAYAQNQNALVPLLNSAAYFIYKQGGTPEPAFFNTEGETAARLVRESGRFREILPARPLPDGGVARIFANLSLSRFVRAGAFLAAGMDQIPDARVIFAGQLQLTGISARMTEEGLEVQYRWRCLRRMERDFWCFTYVLDSRGAIVGYLDHPLLNGEPPATLWREGDAGIERLVLPLPPGTAETFQLRLGVYHRDSGARLTVSESGFPLAEERTAVLVNVAAKAR